MSHKRGAKRASYIVSPEISKDKYTEKEKENYWEVAECLFGHDEDFFTRVKQMLTSPEEALGINNTFTLNDYLSQLWRNCYFGLRPVAPKIFQEVRLEFVWFFRSDTNYDPRAEFTRDDLERMFRPSFAQDNFEHVLEINSKTGSRVETGNQCVIKNSFSVPGAAAANQKLIDMFTVRWATKIQFLAGAAGVHLGKPHDYTESYFHDWTKLSSRTKFRDPGETDSESEPDYP